VLKIFLEILQTLHFGRRVKLVALVTFASLEKQNAAVTSHARNAYQEAEHVYMKQSILAACRLRLHRLLMLASGSLQVITGVL
jgi:hypothetical protein